MSQIRPAVAADAVALAALAAETFPLACPPGTEDSEIERFVSQHLSAERFREYLRDPEAFVVVCESDPGLVGYTLLFDGFDHAPEPSYGVRGDKPAFMSKLYVVPERHGTEVAAALMAAGISWARGRGASSLWLAVNQQNRRAARFYTKHGFEPVGVKTMLVGQTVHDDFVYELDLRTAPGVAPNSPRN